MSTIDDIKKLIDGKKEEKLEVIEKRTRERLCLLLNGADEVPKVLEYIVVDVTLKRFNRIQNEGMKSYSEEGLSFTFQDSDFDEYKDEIAQWVHKDDEELFKPKRGRFKFV